MILQLQTSDITVRSFRGLVAAYADHLLPDQDVDLDVELPDDVPTEALHGSVRVDAERGGTVVASTLPLAVHGVRT